MPSDNTRPPDRDRSIPELFTTAIGQISSLFRKEVQLARAEIGEKFGQAAGAITPLAAGSGLLLGALILLLLALVSLLVHLGVSVGWSQLIVGVVAALVGYVLIRSGLSQLKTSNLIPSRTAEQLSRDAQVTKEQVQ
jgi:Putative Actinobacterial Holin-X, holin superfamily III